MMTTKSFRSTTWAQETESSGADEGAAKRLVMGAASQSVTWQERDENTAALRACRASGFGGPAALPAFLQ